MKKLPKQAKLKLNKETLTHLDQVSGAVTVVNCTDRTKDFTNCPMCGNTNYITCLSCVNC